MFMSDQWINTIKSYKIYLHNIKFGFYVRSYETSQLAKYPFLPLTAFNLAN